MSETKNMRRSEIRWHLLVTVSAVALLGSVYAADAAGDDTDRQQVWIEVGGQVERLNGTPEPLSPPFFSLASPAILAPVVDAQRPSPNSIGEEGKISFAPDGTDWVFSAAIRYGRSSAARHLHYNPPATAGLGPILIGPHPLVTNFFPNNEAYGDGQTSLSESHLVLDFRAGKDVGLGMFGAHGSSVVSAGVRFAQFASGSEITLHARPIYTVPFVTVPGVYRLPLPFHATYAAALRADRSTHAIGPSGSWQASLPLVQNGSEATINFDWGVNAAVLFGRQRARVHHQTTGSHYHKYSITGTKNIGSYMHAPPDQNRSRSVVVPNVGGFAGISFHYADAKVSVGYRGDFFFGALDGGIDTRRTENLSFFGPFATIGIGLGD